MRSNISCLCAALVLSLASSASAQESDLFDANLSKWLGDKEYWSYKEGVLTGATEKGVKRAAGSKETGSTRTYLISKQFYGDFEFAFKVRVGATALSEYNPALQVRSTVVNKIGFLVGGPRLEFVGPTPGLIRGEYPPTNFYFSKASADPALNQVGGGGGFIDYKITVVGKKITVKVEGITATDEFFPRMPNSGVIAWQMGGYGPSNYMVRDIRFRELGKGAKTAAKPKVNEPAKPAPPRFPADASDVFESVSGPYFLDGKPVNAGDTKAALRLVKASDPKLAELARMAVDLFALAQLRTEQGRKAYETLQAQAELGAPLAFAKRIAGGDTNPGIAKIVEDMMGTKVQEEFNRAYLFTYLGLEQAAKLRAQLQKYAESRPAEELKAKKPLAVYCETTPETLGSITIRNDSGRTLRHMLALARVAVDAGAAKAAGEAEMAMGQLLLGMGFKQETVAGSVKAAELRSKAAQIDPGVAVYVAELKPGATVRIPVTHPVYFRNAKSADVSIYSDELTLERQRPSNFYEAQITVRYPSRTKLLLAK